MSGTYMQQLSAAVVDAVETETAKIELRGLSKTQMIASVQAICKGIDELPPETSMHVLLAALTYVRNAVLLAMEENDKMLATHTGGHT